MKADVTEQELLHDIDSPAIPLGYKQTDLGVIPEHWHIKQLADICIPQGIVRGPFGGTLKKDTFVTSGFKVYEQQNAIYKSSEIGSYFVNQSKYAEMRRFSVSPGDFIISCSGTIGRIFQIPPDALQGVINQALLKLTTDDEVVYDQYFYILFEWDEFLIRIIDNTQGGAIKNLVGMDVFRTITVALPPLSEQRAIAEALSDVDGLLSALDALIAKKRAIKQASMQQLLTGKTRLPGFSGAWETKRLGEIALFFKGSSLFTKTDMSLDGKRRCIHYGELFTTYGERISEVLHGTDREEAFFLSVSNDVLMPASDVTPNGLATASCISESDIILGGDILVVRVPREILNGSFLAYVIKINRNQVMQLVTGTTVYHLYGRDMANFKFDLPSVSEQNAIVCVLSDMDAEIAALEQRRDKTIAIKQGMMQQLLTGRVRLSESRICTDETD